ncbi:MAG TPA: hypothetical protein VEK76_10650 [Candidatus Binatia bacterium]|nr:hypothetical protein [Candidatus Binatia bacterium]
MSVTWLAGLWLLVAALSGASGRWPRFRLALSLGGLPLLAVLCLLTSQSGDTPNPLSGAAPVLSREAAGLMVAAAVALWLCLLLSDPGERPELPGIGVVGGAAVLLLGAGSPLLFAVAVLLAVGGLSLRWIAVAPGRATLAAGRVAGTGAAALLAAAIFLPVTPQEGANTPAAGFVGALLVTGLIAITALVPLGGWAAGAMSRLEPVEAATWLLLLAPALLVAFVAVPQGLPAIGRQAFQHTLLACGLLSVLWAGAQALRSGGSRPPGPETGPGSGSPGWELPGVRRYRRLAIGDLALVAVGVGTVQPVAVAGGLVLILAHLVAAPVLLQEPRSELAMPRRLLWLALSGIPPAPSFWGRLLVLEGCARFSGPAMVVCLVAEGLMVLAGIRALARPETVAHAPSPAALAQPGSEPASPSAARAGGARPFHHVAVAWALGAAAIVLAVVPMVAVHLVFGANA